MSSSSSSNSESMSDSVRVAYQQSFFSCFGTYDMPQRILRISITLGGMIVGPVVGCLRHDTDVEVKFKNSMDGKVRFYLSKGANNVSVSFNVANTDTREVLRGGYDAMA
jgi:hypothetical protein